MIQVKIWMRYNNKNKQHSTMLIQKKKKNHCNNKKNIMQCMRVMRSYLSWLLEPMLMHGNKKAHYNT
jgi:hypothetical protein